MTSEREIETHKKAAEAAFFIWEQRRDLNPYLFATILKVANYQESSKNR